MGWQEILLIVVVAVLVIGPDQLPQVARTIGKMVAQFRRISNELRDTVNREFTENEDFREFREFHQSVDAEFRNFSRTAQDYVEAEISKEEEELRKVGDEVKKAGEEVREAIKEPENEGEEAGTVNASEASPADEAGPAAGKEEPAEGDPTPGHPKDSWTYVPDEVPPAAEEPTVKADEGEAETAASDSPRTETA